MSNQTKTQDIGQSTTVLENDYPHGGETQTTQRLVPTKTAAEVIGGSAWWLYQNADRLPGVYKLGRALRWSVPELLEGLRAKK